MGYLLADLHVHSALSPCAANEMTPHHILDTARQSGISILGIADHNSAGNVASFMALAPQYGITIVPAMEVETVEEVHVLTLFPKLASLLAWEELVHKTMPQIANKPNIFGDQLLFDENGQVKGQFKHLLSQSCGISLEKVVADVINLDGVSVPSHVFRKANGIMSVLGFIPQDLKIFSIEISRQRYSESSVSREVASRYNCIVNSDAHCLRDLYGSPTTALQVEQNSAESVISMLQRTLTVEEVVII